MTADITSRQVDGRPLFDAALGSGEEEQCVDETFGFFVVDPKLLQDRPQFVGSGGSIREGFVDEHSFGREWGSQFVRCVGREAALALKGAVEAAQHGVERVGELFEFVVGSLQVDAVVQRPFGEAAGGVGDAVHGSERPAGHPPRQPERRDGEQRQTRAPSRP